MKTIKQALEETKALIAEPRHWTQKTSARDASGYPVSPFDKDACSFCLSGALTKVLFPKSLSSLHPRAISKSIMPDVEKRLNHAAKKRNDAQSYIALNDLYTHADVISLLDLAIEQEALRETNGA